MKDPYEIIQTVLVTEKGTELSDKNHQYTFKVSKGSNKIEIRHAVEALFDVKVASVNVMNRLGKQKRVRWGRYGNRPDWKKAVVTLSEGTIQIL